MQPLFLSLSLSTHSCLCLPPTIIPFNHLPFLLFHAICIFANTPKSNSYAMYWKENLEALSYMDVVDEPERS
jgi:hypothetical protein